MGMSVEGETEEGGEKGKGRGNIAEDKGGRGIGRDTGRQKEMRRGKGRGSVRKGRRNERRGRREWSRCPHWSDNRFHRNIHCCYSCFSLSPHTYSTSL